MDALRVSFHLSGPVAEPSQPLHFDALLGRLAADEALAEQREPGVAVEHLPLQRKEFDGSFVWCASQVFFIDPQPLGMLHRIRRTDHETIFEASDNQLLQRPRKTVDAASGALRTWAFAHPMIAVEDAHAWCIGDRSRIELLLSNLTHLGSLAKLGYGRITAITVTRDKNAERNWLARDLPDTPAARAKLTTQGMAGAPVIACCRPPYWDARGRGACLRVGEEGLLD